MIWYIITAALVICALIVFAVWNRNRSRVRYIVYSRRFNVSCFKARRFRSIYAAKKHVWTHVPLVFQTTVGYTVVPIIPNKDRSITKFGTLAVDVPPRHETSRIAAWKKWSI